MKLLVLALDHFKGVYHFEFAPGGRNADIFGDNATGKTTIADSYFWLLFGKDSAGNSDFGILPEDENGAAFDGLEASVAGTFWTDDGKEFTLRRVYHQKFSRKRGEAEKEQHGNTTEFYIDDVPKPMKDYTAFVTGICEEKTFRLLTDPDMFPGKMKWDERRDVLIKAFAPNLDDRQIINEHESLKPLMGYIGYKSVEDYAEATKAQRRKINEELAGIPSRIDEAEKAKPADMPEPGDGPTMLKLQKQKIQLEGEISAQRTGESVASLRRQIADVQAEISKASAEYSRKMSAGNTGLEAEAANTRALISKLSGEISGLENSIRTGESFAAQLAGEMDGLRKQCADTFQLVFNPGDTICPTCGQEYPPEKQDQIQADFNEAKARKLRELEEKGKSLKATRDGMVNDIAGQRQQLEADRRDLADAQQRLDRLTKQYVQPEPFSSTPEYAALKRRLDDAEHQLRVVTEVSDKRAAVLREQLENVTAELDEIKKRALNRDAIARQDQRVEELKMHEKELSEMLATYDNGLLLAEQFTQQKAKDIEDKVNSSFQLVRWKLFDRQVNGGVKACCEATVNGIEYGTNLNSAARLNAGLDIIDTLSRVVGISVPIWIDNAESVTEYLPIDAQVIRLHVSAADTKLRVEAQEK
jgi:uncharacterized Zn finger protein (UPF0148 family)/uncharacterized small protein (DUF1192 family)